MDSGACGGVSRVLKQWSKQGGGGGKARGEKYNFGFFENFDIFFRRKSMIFQDEPGSGGPAWKSWQRMVEGEELSAEVVNNAFATAPTRRKHFINHRKEARERVHRGKCVVSSLRAPFLF